MVSGHPTAERAGELRPLEWRKSRKSTNNDCVEVAAAGGSVFVRDSKNRSGPELHFSSGQWQSFIADITGEPSIS